jgi:hypothetical protein
VNTSLLLLQVIQKCSCPCERQNQEFLALHAHARVLQEVVLEYAAQSRALATTLRVTKENGASGIGVKKVGLRVRTTFVVAIL